MPSFPTLTPFQHFLLTAVLLLLIIWCVIVVVNGLRRYRLISPSTSTNTQLLPAQVLPRTRRAIELLDGLADQPGLLTAHLNYLRMLLPGELRDVILLGLMGTGYRVDLSQQPQIYALPSGSADESALPITETDLFVPLQDSEVASPRKGRLMVAKGEVSRGLEPVMELGCLQTPEGIPVLLSIQGDSRPYSRMGLSTLVRTCEREGYRGVLVYLGTDVPKASISPLVVLLSGPDVLDILTMLIQNQPPNISDGYVA